MAVKERQKATSIKYDELAMKLRENSMSLFTRSLSFAATFSGNIGRKAQNFTII